MIDLQMSDFQPLAEENTTAFNKDGSLATTAPDSAKLLVADLALLGLKVIGVDLDEAESSTAVLEGIVPKLDDIVAPTVVVLWNAAVASPLARTLAALLEAKCSVSRPLTDVIVAH
jgi:hypothetical protein